MYLQKKFGQIAEKLGFGQTGYCHAFSLKVIEAVLTNKFEDLNQLIKQIMADDDTDEIKSFFKSLYVYGQPRKIFPTKKYTKADFQELSLHAGNNDVVIQDGLTSVGCRTNCYYYNQLNDYFLKLEQQLATSTLPSIPLLLSTPAHKAVAIFTPSAPKPWQLIDSNKYNTNYLDHNELVEKVKSYLIFRDRRVTYECITFNTQIILTKQQAIAPSNNQLSLALSLAPVVIEKEKYSFRDGRYIVKAAFLAILYNEDSLIEQILSQQPMAFLENTIPNQTKKWSPLQLAAYLGKNKYVETLCSHPSIQNELRKSHSSFQTNYKNAIELAEKEEYFDILPILKNVSKKPDNQQTKIQELLDSLTSKAISVEVICSFLLKCIPFSPQSTSKRTDLNAARKQILAHFQTHYRTNEAVTHVIEAFFQINNDNPLLLPEEAKAIEKWLTISLYPLARALIKLEIMLENDVNRYALNLCLIFNSSKNLLQYLAEFSKFNPRNSDLIPLKDACQLFIPDPDKVNFRFWKSIANKNKFMLYPTNRAILAKAEYLEDYYKTLKDGYKVTKNGNGETEEKFDESILEAQKLAQLDLGELRKLCITRFIRLSEKQLQNIYKLHISSTESLLLKYKLDIRYSDILHQLKPSNDDSLIPNITIDGADYGFPGIFASKLDITTFRGILLSAILGKITNCCQSIDGASASSVKYGVEKENSGFYIVYKGTKPNNQPSPEDIIGQSWVWRLNKKLCFDTLESRGSYSLQSEFFFHLLAINLNGQYGINTITHGVYGSGIQVSTKEHISTKILTSNGIYTDAKFTQKSMSLDNCHTRLYDMITTLLSRRDEEFLFKESFIKLVEMYLQNSNKSPSITQAITIISWLTVMWIKFSEFINNLWVDKYKDQLILMIQLIYDHQKLHPLSVSSQFFLQYLLLEFKLNFPALAIIENNFLIIASNCSINIKSILFERYMSPIIAQLSDNNVVEPIDAYKINFTLLANRIIENQEIPDNLYTWFTFCHSQSRYLASRSFILENLFKEAIEIFQEFKQIKNPLSEEMLKRLKIEPETPPKGYVDLLDRLNANPVFKSNIVKLVLIQLNKTIHSQAIHNPLNLPTYMESWLKNIVDNQLIKVKELFYHTKKEYGLITAVQIFSPLIKPNNSKFVFSLLLEERIYLLKNIDLSKLLYIPAPILAGTLIKCGIDDRKDIISRCSEAWRLYEINKNVDLSKYLLFKYLLLQNAEMYELLRQFSESLPEIELLSRNLGEEGNTILIENILALQSRRFYVTHLRILEQLLNPFSLQICIFQIISKAQLQKPEIVIELAYCLGDEQDNYLNRYNNKESILELLYKNPTFYNLPNLRNLIRLFRSQESHASTLKRFCLTINNYKSFNLALTVLKELEPPGDFLAWLFDNHALYFSEFVELYLTQLLFQLIDHKVNTTNAKRDLCLPYEDSTFLDKLLLEKNLLTQVMNRTNRNNDPLIFNILQEVTYDYSHSLSSLHYSWWKALLELFKMADPKGLTLQRYCTSNNNLFAAKIRAFDLLQDLLPFEQLKNWLTTIENNSIKKRYLARIAQKLIGYTTELKQQSSDNLTNRNSSFDQVLSDNPLFISTLISIQSLSTVSDQLRDFNFKEFATLIPENWSYENFIAAGLLDNTIKFIMNFIFCLQNNGLLTGKLFVAIFNHYSSFLQEKIVDILLVLASLPVKDSLIVIDSFPVKWHFTFSLTLFKQVQSNLSKQIIAKFILEKNIVVLDEKTYQLIDMNRCLFDFIHFVSEKINPQDLPNKHNFMQLFLHYLTIDPNRGYYTPPKIQHWNFALSTCSTGEFKNCKYKINVFDLLRYSHPTFDEWKTLISNLYNHYGQSIKFLYTVIIKEPEFLLFLLRETPDLLKATLEAIDHNDEFNQFCEHFNINPIVQSEPVSIFFYRYYHDKQNIIWSLSDDVKACINSSWINEEDLINMPNESLSPLSRIRRGAYIINNAVAERLTDPGYYFETLLTDSSNKDCTQEAYDLITSIFENPNTENIIKNKILDLKLPVKRVIRMFGRPQTQVSNEIINLINTFRGTEKITNNNITTAETTTDHFKDRNCSTFYS